MTTPRPRPTALCCLLLLLAAQPARAASALASCQTQLQQSGSGGVEGALRACVPLFTEFSCQSAWRDLLDNPGASPGYGRGASLARLAAACQKAYCGLHGMGQQALCRSSAAPPLSAEFFASWRTFQTAALRREGVPGATSDRLATALQRWAGFLPRPGARAVLQAVLRPDVPGVVGLTLWSAQGERLGAWVTDLAMDEETLNALHVALPVPSRDTAGPCVRLEASPTLPQATTDALLRALRRVCPVDLVTVKDV